MIYKRVCSSLELFLTTATPPSPRNILNNISSLLPFVLKMSQQQVGSLVLTIDVDDLMSILCRIPSVSINCQADVTFYLLDTKSQVGMTQKGNKSDFANFREGDKTLTKQLMLFSQEHSTDKTK